VLIGCCRFETVDRGPLLLVPIGFSFVSAVFFFGMILNDALRAEHGAVKRTQPTAQRPSVLRSLLVAPTDYGVLCLVFLLLGVPGLFAAAYTALFAATATYLLLATGKWYREMRGLAP
jgi:hypothetical protein